MIALVQATYPDHAAADRAARGAVEARLAACANVLGPCRSVYRWRGAVEEADEVAVLFKTAPIRRHRLVDWLTAHHPYELPAIEWWEVAAAPAVEEWVSLETG